MDDLIQKFRQHVIEESKNPGFVHNKWFIRYHLEIVERIAIELCQKHKEADRELVLVLVWLHDYGKILDFSNQHNATLAAGREKLEELGFPKEFAEKALSYTEMLDKKMEIDLRRAPIEAKIISSADGASHLVGPFYELWFYENAEKDIDEIMDASIRKALRDWDRKVVLPEVKTAFADRHRFLLEQNGILPEEFLDSD